jgi:hypothetical protein
MYLGHKQCIWHHLCPFSLSLPPTVAIVVCCCTCRLFINKKKKRKEEKKKKRHKHGGEDRLAIVSVIGTTGWIQFEQINDVIKVY